MIVCEDADVDLETFRWLLTAPGQSLLARATEARAELEAIEKEYERLLRAGEPQKYFPNGQRNYARVINTDDGFLPDPASCFRCACG